MSSITRLPLIVGFGGYNAAGRSSGHNSYKRMVFESLAASEQTKVIAALASLMGEGPDGGSTRSADDAGIAAMTARVLTGTLVRRIESAHFPVDKTPLRKSMHVLATDSAPLLLTLSSRELPHPLPDGWVVRSQQGGRCEVEIRQNQDMTVAAEQAMPVQAAGQLPSGFDPGAYYRSVHHPRGLQLNIMAASDAVQSIGIPWQGIIDRVRPDEIGVYSSSVMSQLDSNGLGGLMQARTRGNRVTSKQLALGLNTMPADFVNAYVLGSVGVTGGVTGACATFLYNLRAGVEDIKSGRRRVAVVGSSEAPILPEVIDGYAAMGALATDAELAQLDGTTQADHRRASRPFGENCGFTLAESGQYVVLMDDALALELGAEVYGAVPGVYVNADGFKKSISAPGPGNYITMAKAVALAQTMLGKAVVQNKSFVQAHGSSTPQNRVTESKIFDKVAETFGVTSWPVAAVKAYLGHSLGPASGDQMAATLGVFAYGLLPGIKTIETVASDVRAERLNISSRDQDLGADNCLVGFLNSKGFGGNNATAAVLSPLAIESVLVKRAGKAEWHRYQRQLQETRARIVAYEDSASGGRLDAIYRFGESLLDESQIEISESELRMPGFTNGVSLTGNEGYDDFSP